MNEENRDQNEDEPKTVSRYMERPTTVSKNVGGWKLATLLLGIYYFPCLVF